MRRIRQFILQNDRKRGKSLSTVLHDRNEPFFVHFSDNTLIRPYCVYPLIPITKERKPPQWDETGKIIFACSPQNKKIPETVSFKPKAYQKLSLHRAKAKRLSSYAANCFSLGRTEKQVFLPAQKQSNKPLRTSVSIVLPKRSPNKYLQQPQSPFRSKSKRTTDRPESRKKLSDRRVIVSHINRSNNSLIGRLPIDAWETFDDNSRE